MLTVGLILFLITLALRGASGNRFVRSRLTISCALFAIYAADSALVAFGRLPDSVADQIRTANPLLLAFGLSNALVVLAINPWRGDSIPERFPNIVQDAIVIGLFGLAAMLFLPEKIVATTAVGAVVVGFALQDTLGNLFAGLAIQIEKPFRVGHWVTIGGQDGMVSEITWRATKIGLQLDELERAEAAARPGDQEQIGEQDERRRAEANQDTSLHAPIV